MSVDADLIGSVVKHTTIFGIPSQLFPPPTHQDLTEHPFNSLPSLLYITGSTERL